MMNLRNRGERQGTVVSCEANRLPYTWRWTSCLLELVWDIYFLFGGKGKFLFQASKMPYIHTGLLPQYIYIYVIVLSHMLVISTLTRV